MFFVSEEFLREYQGADEITQTIDEAVGDGEDLFGGDYITKAEANTGRRDDASKD
ncbi:MAG: hypothetical protein IIC92_08425 [Chloroflexi bacterium]|nr:hypothetical protein [Chloroflexota bacterium]MCH8817737.1 hypothetical protein [Chloroflexota bacterium]